MDNNLLKKAHGALPEPPKKNFEGVYPEAIGGGDPAEAKQVGGYLDPPKEKKAYYNIMPGKFDGSGKAIEDENGMSSAYSRQYQGGFFDKTQMLPTLKNFVENEMGIKGRSTTKVGRSKMAEYDDVDDDEIEYNRRKSDDELQQVEDEMAEENLRQIHLDLLWLAKSIRSHQQEKNRTEAEKQIAEYAALYDEAKTLIQEDAGARAYGQKHMLSVPHPNHVGQDPKELARRKTDGITDAVKKYMPEKFNEDPVLEEMTDYDKAMLHGMRITTSQRAAWDKVIKTKKLTFASNRYSFSKDAGVETRTAFTPLVAKVNRKLNRLHVPKRAAAHEAAMKRVAHKVATDNRQLDKIAAVAKKVLAEKKPKCPECGSTDYGLMPTDFETAKCSKCDKTWEIGIVKGINDPSDSKTAYSYDDEDDDESEEYDGIGDYTYTTNCVSAKGDDISEMVDIAEDVTYDELKEHCQGLKEWELGNGYQPDGGKGLTLRKDWAVSYHRSKYLGRPCYYIYHSAIESVWTKGGSRYASTEKVAFVSPDLERMKAMAKKASAHHCARTECKKCGNVKTCRCSTKKATVEVEACDNCSKVAYTYTPKETAEMHQKLKDEHELNTRLDDHLEAKTCAGCGEQFMANRNDGDFCCYEHSDGHWHGAPEGAGAERVASKLSSTSSVFFNTMNKMALDLNDGEGDQYHDINDPVCICGHEFNDHERGCDHCSDCTGFTPANMKKQVEHLAEYRSFAPFGKSTNPLVFARDPQRGENILKVYIDNDKVTKAEFLGHKGDTPETREGWDGFFSFTQAYGD